MKKLTGSSLVVMLMIFLGFSLIAQARTGSTSDSSRSSSSKSNTSSRSSSSSKPARTTSATDSIFANTAKTKEAKTAWQERNKKPVDNTPVTRVPVPVQDNASRRQEQQLANIQKQIADAKRQQQIIAAAQAALQLATTNKRPTPAPVTPAPRIEPVANTPVNTPVTESSAPDESGGSSWFMILLVIGGIVWLIVWLKRRNTSNTIYRLGSEPGVQDARLPLKINFKTTVTFELNPLLSAITHGAMIDAPLDNLKVLKVQSISSIKIDGMDNKKIHRFYFNQEGKEKRLFLQTLSDANNVDNIDEVLFCSSVTEPPAGEDDIAFFLGDNDTGLGETNYRFSREDLYTFLPRAEVDKRLSASGNEDGVEYSRVNPDEEFMSAFGGIETVIFDANGATGESRQVMNLMPHSRALGSTFEELIVAFWVSSSKNGKNISINDQLPLAEYIFAIKLEKNNINVI